MNNFRISFLAVFLVCLAIPFGIVSFANASDTSSIPDTLDQENAKTDSPSDGVTSRAINRLAPGVGMGIPGRTVAPPTAEPTGFKCSPNTGRCNCAGLADCNYMKDLIKDTCGKITCTGSGSSQKCTCTINGF